MKLDLSAYEQVFDVGANEGQFGRTAIEAGCEVVSFEPLPEPATHLMTRTRRHKGWQAYPVGLASSCGPKGFYANDASVCSSLKPMTDLHKKTYPFSEHAELVTCLFMTLDCFQDHVKQGALLKIDTQGSELDVLLGGRRALDRFGAVLLEVSHEALYEGTPSFAELDAYLSEHGFHHDSRVDEMRHPSTGVLLQSDELWKR